MTGRWPMWLIAPLLLSGHGTWIAQAFGSSGWLGAAVGAVLGMAIAHWVWDQSVDRIRSPSLERALRKRLRKVEEERFIAELVEAGLRYAKAHGIEPRYPPFAEGETLEDALQRAKRDGDVERAFELGQRLEFQRRMEARGLQRERP